MQAQITRTQCSEISYLITKSVKISPTKRCATEKRNRAERLITLLKVSFRISVLSLSGSMISGNIHWNIVPSRTWHAQSHLHRIMLSWANAHYEPPALPCTHRDSSQSIWPAGVQSISRREIGFQTAGISGGHFDPTGQWVENEITFRDILIGMNCSKYCIFLFYYAINKTSRG